MKEGSSMQPNILAVSLAPLRADRLSCYGHSRDTSPNLDRLAGEATLFEHAYATAAWTPPGYASLLTGLYPSCHGVSASTGLGGSIPTLGEALGELGYHTVGFVSTSFIGRLKGLDRGFQQFYEPWRGWGSGATAERGASRDGRLRSLAAKALAAGERVLAPAATWRQVKHLAWRHGLVDKGARRTLGRVLRWLKEEAPRRQPFFLLVHLQETHHPYFAPHPYRYRYVARSAPGVDWRRIQRLNADPYLYMTGLEEAGRRDLEVLRALYDGEIRYLDAELGRLFAALARSGLLDRMVLAVVSPHGESLGEHGFGEHQGCLYEPVVHVPLILRYPPVAPAGLRVESLVQTTDLFATLLELAGGSPAKRTLQGESLLPPASRRPYRPFVVAEYEGNRPIPLTRLQQATGRPLPAERFTRRLSMIRMGPYKYICGSDGSEELFHLGADPGEEVNRIERERQQANQLALALRKFLKNLPAGTGASDPEELAPAVREELRSLGYRI
jgi:arylsulfatase A-like enzyme